MLKLKNNQANLHEQAHFEIKQMKQFLEAVIQNILKKQEDIVKAYDQKVASQKKENKQLVKRIVQSRQKSNTSSRNQLKTFQSGAQ